MSFLRSAVPGLLWVGAGGFLGATLRFLASEAVQRFASANGEDGSKLVGVVAFPWGTLTVNLVGCFFIGLLTSLGENWTWFRGDARLFLMTGLLGGFTTYSTFALDTLQLVDSAAAPRALVYLALHVLLGLLAVWLGMRLGS